MKLSDYTKGILAACAATLIAAALTGLVAMYSDVNAANSFRDEVKPIIKEHSDKLSKQSTDIKLNKEFREEAKDILVQIRESQYRMEEQVKALKEAK